MKKSGEKGGPSQSRLTPCQLPRGGSFTSWRVTLPYCQKARPSGELARSRATRLRGSAFPLGGTDAIYRNGPSRENAIQKRPQAFLNCQYKNFISAKYAQSNAEGILNRPPCPEQANKKASAKKLALARL